MSNPGGHAIALADLPCDLRRFNDLIQGVLVHSDWLEEYGLDRSHLRATSRITLPVADRLADILKRDPSPLETRCVPRRRAIGTCRDFALILCSFLRCHGVPARLRCGFAAYFGGGWEDHWVCEYWDRRTEAWRLSDPQIDQMLKEKYRIRFDPTDVPRASFVTAGDAWLECRSKGTSSDHFGHGDVAGLWFVKVNVFRTHYVLNGKETSAWDGWREAPLWKRVVSVRDVALLDHIAHNPEQPSIEVNPDWLE